MPNRNLPNLRPGAPDSPLFPSFQKEMNRLFDQFRTGFPTPDADTSAGMLHRTLPAIDVVEKADALEISAELPGVKEEDIEASITGDILTIKGQKSAEHKEDRDDFHLVERQYGSFRRQISLGFTPDDDAVSSTFSDGVLKLHVAKPKSSKAHTKHIKIKKS